MSLLKTSLTGLKADSFRHPLDLEATKTLKQIPGLDMMVRTWLGPMAEQATFLIEMLLSSPYCWSRDRLMLLAVHW